MSTEETTEQVNVSEFFDLTEHPDYPDQFVIQLKNVKAFEGWVIRYGKIDLGSVDDTGLLVSYELVHIPADHDVSEFSDKEEEGLDVLLSHILVYLLEITLEHKIGSDYSDSPRQ
jgi:hypothetical protein